jgi:hypothetical protein
MGYTSISETELFSDLVRRECLGAAKSIRQFSGERFDRVAQDCGRSARELATEIHGCSVRMLEVLSVHVRAEQPPRTPPSLAAAIEQVSRDICRAAVHLPKAQWNETVHGNHWSGWERPRRAELLWRALRDLAKLAAHLDGRARAARRGDLDVIAPKSGSPVPV